MVAFVAALTALACVPAQKAQAAGPTSFFDVSQGSWYYPWVTSASTAGLMTGYKDGNYNYTGYFGPEDLLTRAQTAMVLWRVAGCPAVGGGTDFPDVHAGEWHYSAVAWCASAGIVTGYTSGADAGRFCPDRPVSRQELATMVWRFAKWSGVDVADPDPAAFKATTDWRSVLDYAIDALTWTSSVDIMSGVDNPDGSKSLMPLSYTTRAQAAKVFFVLANDVLTGKVTTPKANLTVAFDPNGAGDLVSQLVPKGSTVAKPADPVRKGYDFKGWFTDPDCKNPYDFSAPVTSDLRLYAKWEEQPVSAVLYSDGLLSIQKGADTDPAHGTVLGTWTGFEGSRAPWYGQRNRVRKVVVRDEVAPTQVAYWFSSLSNCGSMDLSKLDVSRVSDFSNLFEGCAALTSLDLSTWDMSSASSLRSMFAGCVSLESLTAFGWDTSRVTDFSEMFSGCSSLRSLPVAGWNVAAGENFGGMMRGCSALATLDVSGWRVSSATDMRELFYGCSSLGTLDLSGWDVSGVRNLEGMFSGCSSLTSVDLAGWNTASAVDLSAMFRGCELLSRLDVASWNTSRVTDFSSMFDGCVSLTSLDLSGWDTFGASGAYAMFGDCRNLASVRLGGRFSLASELPFGVWQNAAGEKFTVVPNGVAGTYTKTSTVAPESMAADVPVDGATVAGEVVAAGERLTGGDGDAGAPLGDDGPAQGDESSSAGVDDDRKTVDAMGSADDGAQLGDVAEPGDAEESVVPTEPAAGDGEPAGGVAEPGNAGELSACDMPDDGRGSEPGGSKLGDAEEPCPLELAMAETGVPLAVLAA